VLCCCDGSFFFCFMLVRFYGRPQVLPNGSPIMSKGTLDRGPLRELVFERPNRAGARLWERTCQSRYTVDKRNVSVPGMSPLAALTLLGRLVFANAVHASSLRRLLYRK
jgi:hypothetical protein